MKSLHRAGLAAALFAALTATAGVSHARASDAAPSPAARKADCDPTKPIPWKRHAAAVDPTKPVPWRADCDPTKPIPWK